MRDVVCQLSANLFQPAQRSKRFPAGPERVVKKIAKETLHLPISWRASLKDLLKSVTTNAGLPAEILLRKGRLANVVQARDRFIREAVFEQGYLASQVAHFLNSHPSNVSRALQKS